MEAREERKGLTITGNTPGPVALVEGEDAVSLRETEEVAETRAEGEGRRL